MNFAMNRGMGVWGNHAQYVIMYNGTVTGLRISAVDGTAFVDNLPADVITLAGSGNNHIEIYSSNGAMLAGVLGSVGTGETYLDLIGGADPALNNGDMQVAEPPGTAWTRSSANIVITGGKAVVTGTAGEKITQARGSVGALLKATAVFDITTLRYYFGSYSSITADATRYGTVQTYSEIGFRSVTNGQTIDNVTYQQVLTPSTSGSTIVSAKQGATQNFTSKSDSFIYNESAYTCRVKRLY